MSPVVVKCKYKTSVDKLAKSLYANVVLKDSPTPKVRDKLCLTSPGQEYKTCALTAAAISSTFLTLITKSLPAALAAVKSIAYHTSLLAVTVVGTPHT